jgi:hypothetical protein
MSCLTGTQWVAVTAMSLFFPSMIVFFRFIIVFVGFGSDTLTIHWSSVIINRCSLIISLYTLTVGWFFRIIIPWWFCSPTLPSSALIGIPWSSAQYQLLIPQAFFTINHHPSTTGSHLSLYFHFTSQSYFLDPTNSLPPILYYHSATAQTHYPSPHVSNFFSIAPQFSAYTFSYPPVVLLSYPITFSLRMLVLCRFSVTLIFWIIKWAIYESFIVIYFILLNSTHFLPF